MLSLDRLIPSNLLPSRSITEDQLNRRHNMYVASVDNPRYQYYRNELNQ